MTKVDFAAYSTEDRATLEDLGTLNSQVGIGGSYRPASKSNFLSEKRVAIIGVNKKGESAVIACSTAVSKALRAKEVTLSQLGNYHILADAEGRLFISSPAGEMPSVSVKSLKEEKVEAISSMTDLIAW